MIDHTGIDFRRSSYCGTSACVEVARLPNGSVAVRDSKNVDQPVQNFSAGNWATFLRGVKADDFNF